MPILTTFRFANRQMSRLLALNPVVSGGLGLAQMSPIDFAKDFCFDVRGKEYYCCRFVACYVSARVAHLSAFDASFNRIFVDVDDASGMFSRILQFAEGGSIDLSSSDVDLSTLLRLSLYIGNEELIQGILDVKWPVHELCIENVLSRLDAKLSENLPVDDETAFIARHFDDVCSNFLNEGSSNLIARLGYDVSSQALSDSNFESSDHDRLAGMILSSGKRFLPLLEFVQLDQCSCETMQKVVSEVSARDLGGGIWKAALKRLLCPISTKEKEPEKKEKKVEQPRPRCSYEEHGRRFISQKFYHCETCGLVGSLGMCEACMQVCHAGHQISDGSVHASCYCDCGAGAKGCQCQICDRHDDDDDEDESED